MVFKPMPVSSEHTEPEHKTEPEPEPEHGSEQDPGSDSDVAEILTQVDDLCGNLRSLVVATNAPDDDFSDTQVNEILHRMMTDLKADTSDTPTLWDTMFDYFFKVYC